MSDKKKLLAAMTAHAEAEMAKPRVKRENKTALSWWFPKIEAAGLPVPKTRLINMPEEAQRAIWEIIDLKEPTPFQAAAMDVFVAAVAGAVNDVGGYPFFFRTDHTSGKHEWSRTCFVTSADDIRQHAFNLAYFSECVSMFGELSWNTYVVREMLPTMPIGVCTEYFNFPICREFRFFVEEGKVRCWHPYWPWQAIIDGGFIPSAEEYEHCCNLSDEELNTLTDLAEQAGRACGGAWSIDFLETKRGWFLTDMAEAHRSFHWEGCEK